MLLFVVIPSPGDVSAAGRPLPPTAIKKSVIKWQWRRKSENILFTCLAMRVAFGLAKISRLIGQETLLSAVRRCVSSSSIDSIMIHDHCTGDWDRVTFKGALGGDSRPPEVGHEIVSNQIAS